MPARETVEESFLGPAKGEALWKRETGLLLADRLGETSISDDLPTECCPPSAIQGKRDVSTWSAGGRFDVVPLTAIPLLGAGWTSCEPTWRGFVKTDAAGRLGDRR